MRTIKANLESIENIFQRNSYVIPDYQRPYTWDKDQCQTLWDDIMIFYTKSHDDKDKNYFLGSITLFPCTNEDNQVANDKWEVIDGQQRLMTLSLLMKAFYREFPKYEGLKESLFTKDSVTGHIEPTQPRLESKVLEEDQKIFYAIITSTENNKEHEKSNMTQNYKFFIKQIEGFRTNSEIDETEEKFQKILRVLLERVQLLRIECESMDDAIQLFQTINDRGTPLDDADIFKARLAEKARDEDNKNNSQKCRNEFQAAWNELAEHKTLFTIYMHILRARDKESGTTLIGLRKYFEREQPDVFNNWRDTLKTLAIIQDIKNGNWDMPNHITKWWKLLDQCASELWRYPLYVFLHEKLPLKNNKTGIIETKSIQKDFEKLIKETVKYFIIAGFVHKTAHAFKSTVYSSCVSIAQGEGALYQQKIDSYRKTFKDNIRNYRLSTSQYDKIIIYLVACLCQEQDDETLINALSKKVEIEHILPKKWKDYDGWDDKSHSEYLNKLGNLMLLSKKANSQASNDFLKYKKEVYKVSIFADARSLAANDGNEWKQEQILRRGIELEERINRIWDF